MQWKEHCGTSITYIRTRICIIFVLLYTRLVPEIKQPVKRYPHGRPTSDKDFLIVRSNLSFYSCGEMNLKIVK